MEVLIKSIKLVDFDEKPLNYTREIASGACTHFIFRNSDNRLSVVTAASLAGKPLSRLFIDLAPKEISEFVIENMTTDLPLSEKPVLVCDSSGSIVGILPSKNSRSAKEYRDTLQIQEHYERLFSAFRHEIGNICNGLSGVLELDKAQFDNPQIKEMQTKILRLANEKLCEFTEFYLGKGGQKGQTSPGSAVAVEKILQDAVLLSTSDALRKNITIHTEHHHPEATLLKLPSLFALQVFLNLLQNAIRYTQKGNTIGVSTQRVALDETYYLLVSISDTGTGIPEHEMDRIFDEGFRGKFTNETKGQGVGLALVKNLVTKLSASIEVFSPPRYFPIAEGVGTEFCIYFPLKESGQKTGEALVKAGET